MRLYIRLFWYVYFFWIVTTILLGIAIGLDVFGIVVLPQWFILAAVIVILARWLVMFLLWVFGGLK